MASSNKPWTPSHEVRLMHDTSVRVACTHKHTRKPAGEGTLSKRGQVAPQLYLDGFELHIIPLQTLQHVHHTSSEREAIRRRRRSGDGCRAHSVVMLQQPSPQQVLARVQALVDTLIGQLQAEQRFLLWTACACDEVWILFTHYSVSNPRT